MNWAHFSQWCCTTIICGSSAATLQRKMSSSAHSRCLNFPPRVNITQPLEVSCFSVVLLEAHGGVFHPSCWSAYSRYSREVSCFLDALTSAHAVHSQWVHYKRGKSLFQRRQTQCAIPLNQPINGVLRVIGTVSRSCLWMSDTRSLWSVRSLEQPEPKHFLKCSQAHTCVLCLCIPALHTSVSGLESSAAVHGSDSICSQGDEWATLSKDSPFQTSWVRVIISRHHNFSQTHVCRLTFRGGRRREQPVCQPHGTALPITDH